MKIAFFMSSDIKKNKGGPSGYLYNLNEGLKKIGCSFRIFSVYPEESQTVNQNKSFKENNNPIYNEIRSVLYWIKKGYFCKKKVDKGIHDYEIIHVHSCEDVFFLRKFIKYKGKIILTSHRPEPLHNEIIEQMRIKLQSNWPFILLKRQLKYIEKYGYAASDAFIFPSKGAMDIYQFFPGFIEGQANKPIEYLFTGVDKKPPSETEHKYRQSNNISQNRKVISFIGRHNKIKGYDLLTSLADRMYDNNITVVCAGANNLLPSPENDKWIELGHISDPNNLINASDVVVIPNRNTYFDLIIIEILSLGGMVITSDTGGNLDISKHTEGLKLFKAGDIDALYNVIMETLNLSLEKKKYLTQQNIEFYERFCTLEKFAKNYIDGINNLGSKILGESVKVYYSE